jgi:hypothetical protein
MMIMLYTKAAINNLMEKYLKMNRKRNGVKNTTSIQLIKDSQFFLSLNTFNRKKNSLKDCAGVGFERPPSPSFHPYAGGSSTLSKNAIVYMISYKKKTLVRYVIFLLKKNIV